MLTIDGNGLVLGRLATQVAKKLILGEEIHLVNCEKIIITGNEKEITEHYTQRRRLQNKGTPEKSPSWPKVPNLLVRRIIRGMLPWKSSRGKAAFRRLRVYIANPKNISAVSVDAAKPSSISKFITIENLCLALGYAK